MYKKWDFSYLPNFIVARYSIEKASLSGETAIFIYPKKELEEIDALKRHIVSIEKVEKVPVVLVLKELSYRQKQYLLRERIPFIVEGKQIYLPFMALYLQEMCSAEKQMVNEILPSAEMLLLYFIYKGADKLLMSQAVKDLGLTATSLSRASKQLVEVGFLQSKRIGLQKVLFSKETREAVFQKAKELLPNPIKCVVYIPKELVDSDLLESGYSALSKY